MVLGFKMAVGLYFRQTASGTKEILFNLPFRGRIPVLQLPTKRRHHVAEFDSSVNTAVSGEFRACGEAQQLSSASRVRAFITKYWKVADDMR